MMRFGDFLLSQHVIEEHQLKAALEKQNSTNRPLGNFAVERGFISRKDNVKILVNHLKSKKRYGDVALEMGLLDQEQLQEILRAQEKDHLLLGKILMEEGAITRRQLIICLKEFVRLIKEE